MVRMVVFHLPQGLRPIFNRHLWLVCLATIIILILIDQSFDGPVRVEIRHCNATCIQRHYMNHLSVHNLLQTKPVRRDIFSYEILNDQYSSKSYERRRAIRETYGNLLNVFKHIRDSSSRLIVRLLFMLDVDERRIRSIEFEQRIFGDIVQVKLLEHYSMATYRDLAILDWSSRYCPQARFIFKTDDHSFINSFLLLKFINENPNDRVRLNLITPLNIENNCPTIDARLPTLYGFIHSRERVLRRQSSRILHSERYVVLEDEYPDSIYPNFLNNHAYIMSNDARDLILCTFYRQSSNPLSISNVYITGLLPEYLNIDRQPLLNYQLNNNGITCEKFFSVGHTAAARAFACVTSDLTETNIFERYHVYWQIIINAQTNNRPE